MISVLIPTFNYDITDLVATIHNQLSESGVQFEIICHEDGSDNKKHTSNKSITNFDHTKHLISKNNIGSVFSRQKLAEEAQYSWLLFLDADVMPKFNDFITKYINVIYKNSHSAIYGGICYHNKNINPNTSLRWKYGRLKEQVSAKKRNKLPFKHLLSANFLIRKDVFMLLNSKITENSYGLDNYFSALFKQNNYSVLHINNETFHLGIEENYIYLKKKKKAAKTLLHLYRLGKLKTSQNGLLSLYITCEKVGMHYIFSYFYTYCKTIMETHLLGKNPAIEILQLYRISYLCYLDIHSKNA